MGHLRSFFLILLIRSWEADSIMTRLEQRAPVRNFRRHTGPLPPTTDWELGLREAVHQSFIREHHPDPDLHDRILAAPIIGRQDSATPFGDVAVLARGQVYETPGGYEFVQDPYRNDCDDCHNPNTNNRPIEPWLTSGGKKRQLLALWTVKRIRHRDLNYGHVFELEYTISPVTAAVREGLLMRNGHYNYNVPGHVFVIKSDPKLNSAYYQHNNAEKHQKIAEWYHDDHHPGYDSKSPGFFKPGIVVGVTPDGYKQVLQSYPGFFSSYQPTVTYQHDQTTVDPKEYELYKKLIESLAQKTTHGHRFAPTTQATYVPHPQTQTSEFVRFPDGQLYPITTTTSTGKVPTTTLPLTYHEDIFGPPTPLTTSLTPSFIGSTGATTTEMRFSPLDPLFHTTGTSLSPPKTTPVTTVHYFTPIEEPEKQTSAVKPVSTTVGITAPTTASRKSTIPDLSTMKSTKTTTSKLPQTVAMTKLTTVTKPSTELVSITKPARTTKLTTVHKKPSKSTEKRKRPISESGDEDFDLFPESKVTKPTLPSSSSTLATKATTTLALPEGEEGGEGGFDLFPGNTPTQPMTSSTSPKPHPDSINEQLPPPDKDTDTTIPYVAGTATQPTVISTNKETTQTEPSTLVQYTLETTGKTETIPISTELPTTREISTIKETTKSEEPPITTTMKYAYTFTTDDIRKSTRPVQQETTLLPQTTSGVENTLPVTRIESTTFREPTVTFTNTHAGSTGPSPVYEESATSLIAETTDSGTTFPVTTRKPSSTSRNTIKYSRKTRPTKKSTTTASDYEFLASESGDANNSSPSPIDNRKDFNDDDIFGEMKARKPPKPTKQPVQKVTQSDLEEALFGGNRRAKQIKLSSILTPRSAPDSTQIIFSDFFAPSTQTPITYDHNENNLLQDSTTEYRPLTEQSQSTSISFQVNRNEAATSPFANLDLEPTIMAKITEVVGNNHADYRIYKAELPPEPPTAPLYSGSDNGTDAIKKVFDDVALQLVNHARSIDYLNKKPSRRAKYKRRSHPPKVPRGGRRLNGTRSGNGSRKHRNNSTRKT